MDFTLEQAAAFWEAHQRSQALAMASTRVLRKAQPLPLPSKPAEEALVFQAVKLWGQYAKAADKYEVKARSTHGADDLRKAVVFRRNANTLMAYLHNNQMVKGYPIPKKLKWRGMDVSIENPAGSVRNWHDPIAGNSGFTFMLYDYGYLRGTTGTDRDQVDVFMGPNLDEPLVYVVRQMKPPGFDFYDEDKCMIGFRSLEAATQAYRAHYDNPGFCGRVDPFPVDAFLRAVRATKKAPAPVGGWGGITVQSRVSDLRELLPASILRRMDDRELGSGPPVLQGAPGSPERLNAFDEASALDLQTYYTPPPVRS